MAISHWKNRSEQDKFLTSKGLIFYWITFWLGNTAFINTLNNVT